MFVKMFIYQQRKRLKNLHFWNINERYIKLLDSRIDLSCIQPKLVGGGDRGAGEVREMGEERAGGGISTMAGSRREIKKVKLFFCYCLLPVKETNPTTFLDFHLTFSEA